MNKVILMGRLTRDPDIRYSQGENSQAIARYTLAVDRRFRKEGSEQTADFIGCVAFGRQAEFAEKYLHQGTKIAITGRIQTGSYTNKEGQKVYTTDVVVEEQEFAESKASSQSHQVKASDSDQTQTSDSGNKQVQNKKITKPQTDSEGFMSIPDGIEEELPFA